MLVRGKKSFFIPRIIKHAQVQCVGRIPSFYYATNLSMTVGFNPLNAELNPICPLLELFGAHHILHVSK